MNSLIVHIEKPNNNLSGTANQHLAYMSFGENFVDERATGHDIRFKFTGKERDSETGFDYFGARYYSSDLSIWLSVDPLASMYPQLSPFMYAEGNPVMIIDPNGMNTIRSDAEIFEESFKDDLNNSQNNKPIKNVVIGIRNGTKAQEYDDIKNSNPNGAYDGWHVIAATDIEDANTQLQAYMKGNNISELDNLVLSTHSDGKAFNITKGWGPNNSVHILDYNYIKEFGTDLTGWEPAIVNALRALNDVVNTLGNNGNLIFTGCNNGGDGALSKNVHDFMNSTANVYNNMGSGVVFRKGKLMFNSLSTSNFIHHSGNMIGNIDIFDNRQKPIVIHPN